MCILFKYTNFTILGGGPGVTLSPTTLQVIDIIGLENPIIEGVNLGDSPEPEEV